MRRLGVLETKTQLSSLLDGIEAGGEPVLITRHGRPVAKLVAASPESEQPGRVMSGEEIANGFRDLREYLARKYPDTLSLTWEELKRTAHE